MKPFQPVAALILFFPILSSATFTTQSTSSRPQISAYLNPTGYKKSQVNQIMIWDIPKLKVELSGFEPNSAITIKAHRLSFNDLTESFAEYRTDRLGQINLEKTAPLSGTYDERGSFGIFWSMDIVKGASSLLPDKRKMNPDTLYLSVWSENKLLAQTELKTLRMDPTVKVIPLPIESGLVGELYLPQGKGPLPGMVTFGGGDVGLLGAQPYAKYLASLGYATLAIAYFDREKDLKIIPRSLKEIPVEYFQKAVQWLKVRPEVNPKRIGIMGGSKGGEAALVMGSMISEVKAVVAACPSHVIWGDMDEGMSIENQSSSWSLGGKPLPFVPFDLNRFRRLETVTSGSYQGQIKEYAGYTFKNSLGYYDDRALDATIRVENTQGPILMFAGQDDQMWPACDFSKLALNRLKEKSHPYKDQAVCYPKMGHCGTYFQFSHKRQYIPYHHPDGSNTLLALGGKPRETAFSHAAIERRIRKFLKEQLAERLIK